MITVVLADDENMIRTAMAALIDLEDDLEVVGQAASGAEALAVAERAHPAVAVLDLQMPGPSGAETDGIDTAVALQAAQPGIACVIVTSHGRPGYLKRALASGVLAFLPKTASASVLARTIRAAAAGERYVDPGLATEAVTAGDSPLTPREADVLELAADGSSIEDIARRASLSPGTARNYLSSAASKLGAANRHHAAYIARAKGWI